MKKRTGAPPQAAKGGKNYVPDAGHLVWLSFSPQAGREQAGRRPALVLSPSFYNVNSGLCLVCPITNQAKGYPFEVALPEGLLVQGVVLSDHLKSADWRVRKMAYIADAPPEVVDESRAKLRPLLGM